MLSTIALDTQVIQPGLCTGCGACQGLCPYWGSVDGRTVCFFDCERHDGRCQRFCPRMPVDLEALRKQFFPSEDILPEIGPYRGLYLTRAADESVRAYAQHGGTMTALVELAMKEGFIDAAVLTRSQGGLDPEGVLAASPEEVRSCEGSSFQVPPTLAVLNRALKEDRYKKIGVVGTPCKTLAVYKMRANSLPDNDNNARNIGMVFGLFCGWGLDWDGLKILALSHCSQNMLCHMDIPPSKFHSLELTEYKRTISVNLDEVLPLVRSGCRYCVDMTAEFADLSVGGARSADGWDVDKGWNQVIVRSEKGEALLNLAREKGVLEFKEVPDGGLAKLKGASMGKKRTGVGNLKALGGLGYLEPSAALFENL